jgi:hypothetical protein
MDAAGIDMQVLSLTSPGTEQVEAADAVALAREANDFLPIQSRRIRHASPDLLRSYRNARHSRRRAGTDGS